MLMMKNRRRGVEIALVGQLESTDFLSCQYRTLIGELSTHPTSSLSPARCLCADLTLPETTCCPVLTTPSFFPAATATGFSLPVWPLLRRRIHCMYNWHLAPTYLLCYYAMHRTVRPPSTAPSLATSSHAHRTISEVSNDVTASTKPFQSQNRCRVALADLSPEVTQT